VNAIDIICDIKQHMLPSRFSCIGRDVSCEVNHLKQFYTHNLYRITYLFFCF